jgi:hypothetical protein
MTTPGVPFWDRKIKSTQKRPTGDLIPQTSWGSSLANVLSTSQWQQLRLAAIERAKHQCELCGVGEESGSLEGHEMWSYKAPMDGENGEFGIQTLEDIVAVCKECHGCFHLGFAQVRGIEKQVLRRLQILNEWGSGQMKSYQEVVWARWESFSQHHWLLNLTGWDVGEGLVLKKSVVRDETDAFVLFGKSGNPMGVLGVPYRIHGETEWSLHEYEEEHREVPSPGV